MTLIRVSLVAFCLVLAPAAVGHANGRFPEANQLVVDSADASHLVSRTSFGIVSSFDAGRTWTWVCEESISPLGLVDEEMLIGTEGRTSVALGDGIATTSDRQGCQWNRAPGDVAGERVMDLVGDYSDRSVAYAGVNIIIAGAFHGRIARTRDGLSWAFIGEVLASTVPLTIDIAASRPQRLYLGVNDGNFEFGYVDVSDDAGTTWTRHASPAGVDSIYVSGVDPRAADRVYVRETFPDNSLHVSEDGAVSWRRLYTGTKPLKGFALSPDGSQVAIGGEDGFVILSRSDGADGTSVFTTSSLRPVNVKCLTWTTAGLYACSEDTTDGFTLGLSRDEGMTFLPLLRLAELRPAWCPQGTGVARSCPQLWCMSASQFDASCAPAVMPKGPSSGCGCRLAGGPEPAGWLVALLFLMAAAGAARARRRGRHELRLSSTNRKPGACWRT